MAVLYFTSPILQKNLKLEAVAGDSTSVLDLALENDIDIPFACENGMCGLCLIKVKRLDGERHKFIPLTENERESLAYMGKLSDYQEEAVKPDDTPVTYRLACQTTISDSDMLIEFTGEPE